MLTFNQIKQQMRRGNYYSGFISFTSWQSVIATKKEVMSHSYVNDVSQEERKEWRAINALGKKSIKAQEKLENMKEDF